MTIWILQFSFIIIVEILYVCKYINKKTFCIVVGMALIIVSGLRDISIGLNDTEFVYIPSFHLVANTSWKSLLSLRNRGISNLDDIGFLLLMKILSSISSNDNFFVFMTSFPYIWVLMRFIYNYSKSPFLSTILALSLNLYFGTFYLIRHTVAATVLICALDFFIKRKLKLFVTFVVIAATIHFTAICFLIVLPLRKIKIRKSVQVIIILLSLVIGRVGLGVWTSLISLISYVYPLAMRYLYSQIGEFGETWFIAAAIILCSIIFSVNNEDQYNIFENLSIIACICYGLMPLLSEFSRIALFFAPGLLIILPDALSSIRNTGIKIFSYIATTFLFGAYFFILLPSKNLAPYNFFFM